MGNGQKALNGFYRSKKKHTKHFFEGLLVKPVQQVGPPVFKAKGWATGQAKSVHGL